MAGCQWLPAALKIDGYSSSFSYFSLGDYVDRLFSSGLGQQKNEQEIFKFLGPGLGIFSLLYTEILEKSLSAFIKRRENEFCMFSEENFEYKLS